MRISIGLASTLALISAGAASAEISLFGDARLGLGYNIANDGEPALEDKRSIAVDNPDFDPTEPPGPDNPQTLNVVTREGGGDDLRAISRVRFGVTMVGESDSGISFGATIRADNAVGGQGGERGQRDGDVFVTGEWGTLTFGDTDGADYARVGDPVGNLTLTGLGDYNELPFLSNGGGSDNDELQFLANPDDRPTVRYDYDLESFGVSLSTNRDLNAYALGAEYAVEFEDGRITIGAGWYDFSAFEGEIDNVGAVDVPDGDQWAVSLRGFYGGLAGAVAFTSIDAGDLGRIDVLTGGAGYKFEAWSVLAYYSTVTTGDEGFGEALDGRDSYGVSAAYDLGGGASIRGGVARSYGAGQVGEPGDAEFSPSVEQTTLADFGISMNF